MSEIQSDMLPMRVFNPTLEIITVEKRNCIGKVTPAVSCERMDVRCNTCNRRVFPHLQGLCWVKISVTELPQQQHGKVAK